MVVEYVQANDTENNNKAEVENICDSQREAKDHAEYAYPLSIDT